MDIHHGSEAIRRRFLRRVNRLPVPLTLPHLFRFSAMDGDMATTDPLSPEFWDRLRIGDAHFVLPQERDAWLAYCESCSVHDGVDSLLPSRAAAIAAILCRLKVQRLFSVGVGAGALEYHVKKSSPDVHLVCSDYAPWNVEVLRRVFTECEDVVRFDVARDDWSVCGNTPGTLCLIWRVDPLLTDAQWRAAFERAHAEGVRHILFGAGGLLTLSRIARRLITRLQVATKGVSMMQAGWVRVGWVRTEPAFPRLWQSFYRTSESSRAPGMTIFLLERE